MDGRVCNKYRPPTDECHGNTDRPMSGAVVDGLAHIVERDGEVAGEACHHRIGIAHGDHAGCKDVAILIDHALTVTQQEAIALKAFIKEVRVVDIALGDAGVRNLDILIEFQTAARHRFLDLRLATDQDGATEAGAGIAVGGADHAVFLAFRKHNTLRRHTYLAEHALQRAGNGIKSGGK